MKAIIEIEINGDFEYELSDEDVKGVLDFVIIEGAEIGCLSGSYVVKEIIER